MSSSIPSVKDLINVFPRTVTPITSEPNYDSLKNLKDQLKANTASIPTTLGGGNHGYLGLILSPTAYVTIAPTPFEEPNYPGQHPTIPDGTNAANMSAIIRCHTKDLQQWRECKNIINNYFSTDQMGEQVSWILWQIMPGDGGWDRLLDM